MYIKNKHTKWNILNLIVQYFEKYSITVQQLAFRGWHIHSHLWKFATWRFLFRGLTELCLGICISIHIDCVKHIYIDTHGTFSHPSKKEWELPLWKKEWKRYIPCWRSKITIQLSCWIAQYLRIASGFQRIRGILVPWFRMYWNCIMEALWVKYALQMDGLEFLTGACPPFCSKCSSPPSWGNSLMVQWLVPGTFTAGA